MIDNLTKKEVQKSISIISEFTGLNFIYKDKEGSSYIFDIIGNDLEILLDQSLKSNLKEKHRLNNLIKWNSEITIKVIHLRNTFIYMSTYLDRYKISNNSKDQQYFRYLAEIISYFIVSVRDCILQLINSFIDSNVINDYAVNLSSLKKELNKNRNITNQNILNIIEGFESDTKKFREEIRNGFAHKTNPFNSYYTTTFEANNSLGINYGDNINNDDFYEEVLKNIQLLSLHIESLRKIIKLPIDSRI